jgi:hypothetical protein
MFALMRRPSDRNMRLSSRVPEDDASSGLTERSLRQRLLRQQGHSCGIGRFCPTTRVDGATFQPRIGFWCVPGVGWEKGFAEADRESSRKPPRNCPRFSGFTVPDLLKSLSANYRNPVSANFRNTQDSGQKASSEDGARGAARGVTTSKKVAPEKISRASPLDGHKMKNAGAVIFIPWYQNRAIT